jgi:hypothetical protein
VPRVTYDGFSVVLPAGWEDFLDDATYSDPDQLPPTSFAGPGRAGALFLSTPLFEREEQPGARPSDAEVLVADWARRRGLDAPISAAKDSDVHGGFATAIYRLADDYVQVWFLSNGRAVIQASYVCPWSARATEREDRESIVASLRFV